MQHGKTVTVLNRHGEVLMSCTPRKARILVQSGKAEWRKKKPRPIIQLKYGSTGYKQPGTLGIDAGYKELGFSVVNEREELVSGELKLLEGISEHLGQRAMYRGQRRGRIRHRRPKGIDNHQPEGWLAPSIDHKYQTHKKMIDLVSSWVPVKDVVIEVGSFDTQKLNNPDISGVKYQQGEKYGFDNLRQAVFHRDKYLCQVCRKKEKQVLRVHHIGYWKQDRSDRMSNLLTVCIKCHTPANHAKSGKLWGLKAKRTTQRAAAFMSSVWKRLAFESGATPTYGYITKGIRREYGIPKSHANDAFVIAGGTKETRARPMKMMQVRRHKRAMEQFYDAKYLDTRDGKPKSGQELFSGRTTRNKEKNGENLRQYRGHKISKGQRRIKTKRYLVNPQDIVLWKGEKRTVKGMQNLGTTVAFIKKESDSVANPTSTIKKVKLLERKGGICLV